MARGRKTSALGKTAGELLKGKPASFKARPGITPEETEKARQNGIASAKTLFEKGDISHSQYNAMLKNLGVEVPKRPVLEKNIDPKNSATEKAFGSFKNIGLFKGQEKNTVNLRAEAQDGSTAHFRKVGSTTWRGADTWKEMSFEKSGYAHPFIRVYADPRKAELFMRKHQGLVKQGGGQASLIPEEGRKLSDIEGKYFMEIPLLPQKSLPNSYYGDVFKLFVDEKTIRPIKSSVTEAPEQEYEVRTRKKEKEWEMDVPYNERIIRPALPPKRGEAFVAPVPGMTDDEIRASRDRINRVKPAYRADLEKNRRELEQLEHERQGMMDDFDARKEQMERMKRNKAEIEQLESERQRIQDAFEEKREELGRLPEFEEVQEEPRKRGREIDPRSGKPIPLGPIPEEYEVRSRKGGKLPNEPPKANPKYARDEIGFQDEWRIKPGRKGPQIPEYRNILPPAPAGSAKAAEAEKAAKEGGGGGKGEKSKKAGGGYYGGGGGEAFDMSSVMALLLFLVILAIALGFISMLF